MRLPEGQRSTAWVKRLPKVVSALKNEVTSLIDKKPSVAIKEKAVYRPVGESEKLLPSLVQVVISTSLASLKEEQNELQIQSGL